MASLEVGITGSLERTVRDEDTASTIGSGSLAVLATPVMIAAAEQACADLVQPLLDEGMSTVGTRLDIRHLAPTPVGMSYRVDCELTAVNGRVLSFNVVINDECERVGEGTHERVIINEERFLKKALGKKAA